MNTRSIDALPIGEILEGDCRDILPTFPSDSVDLIMYSPPYWGLRNYGVEGQLGLEPTHQEFIENLVAVNRELRRILKREGSMYLNLGDTYASKPPGNTKDFWSHSTLRKGARAQTQGLTNPIDTTKAFQPKQKLLMPYRVAIALQEDGWICRNDVTWHKPNAMPSSVKDRLTCTTERIFHFVKSRRYYYDLDAIRIPSTTPSQVTNSGMSSKRSNDRGGKDLTKGRNLHRNRVQTFNLRVRDVSKGKTGMFVEGGEAKELRASREEVVEHMREKGSGGHFDHSGLDSPEKSREHARGKNPGDFWSITTKPFPEAHFAVYPEEICVQPIKSSCPWAVCVGCGKPRTRITNRHAKFEIQIPTFSKGELGKYLKEWRMRKGLTQGELGELMSITGRMISWWENSEGKNKAGDQQIPTSQQWQLLKAILGFDDHFDFLADERLRENQMEYLIKGKSAKSQKKTWSGSQGLEHGRTRPQQMRFGRANAIHRSLGWTDCGCGKGFKPGIVLDPMCGAGTTLKVAQNLGRRWVGIELNPDYVSIARQRLKLDYAPLEQFVGVHSS